MMFVLSSICLEDIVDCFVSSLDVALTLWMKGCSEGMLNSQLLIDRCDDVVDELGTSVSTEDRWKSTDVEEDIFDKELRPRCSIVLGYWFYPTIP